MHDFIEMILNTLGNYLPHIGWLMAGSDIKSALDIATGSLKLRTAFFESETAKAKFLQTRELADSARAQRQRTVARRRKRRSSI